MAEKIHRRTFDNPVAFAQLLRRFLYPSQEPTLTFDRVRPLLDHFYPVTAYHADLRWARVRRALRASPTF